MATSSKAQIKELIDRLETIMNKAIGRTKPTLGVVLLAAKNATGTATINASTVPSVAILMVSHNGRHNSFI